MTNTYPGYFFGNIRSRPYVLLGFAGFVTGIWSFIPSMSDIIDINTHDTFYLFAGLPFYKFFAAVLLFLWSIYLIADRLPLSHRLTLFHVLSTLTPLIFFVIIHSLSPAWDLDGIPGRYYAMDQFRERQPLFSPEGIYIAAVLILFIGQVFFIINLLLGAIKSFRRNNG
jgi:hypothetical protein